MGRLTARAGGKGARLYAPTIRDASVAVDNIGHSDVVILHTGVNDLKSKNVEQVALEYEYLIHKVIAKPVKKIITSLPTPSMTKPWNQKISNFNRVMFDKLRGLPKVTICTNSNFMSYGSPLERLFADDVHLSPNGTRLLSGNLIRTLFGPRTRPAYTSLHSNSDMDTMQNRKRDVAAEIARVIMNAL